MVARLTLCVLLALAAGLNSGCGNSSSPTASIADPGTNSPAPESPAALPAKRYDDKHPVVVIHTSLGQITVELDAEHAPITVDNFLGYVTRSFYDGTIFHEVENEFIVLGGGYTPALAEKPTDPPIRNEAHNGQLNIRGSIAMARKPDAMDSATSQFFINLADNTALDFRSATTEGYGYCPFGKVTAGMDVVEKIAASAVRTSGAFDKLPVETVTIQSVERIR